MANCGRLLKNHDQHQLAPVPLIRGPVIVIRIISITFSSDRGDSFHQKTAVNKKSEAPSVSQLELVIVFEAVFLVETINGTIGLSKLLLTRVEWVRI